jgi:hypothetical protein
MYTPYSGACFQLQVQVSKCLSNTLHGRSLRSGACAQVGRGMLTHASTCLAATAASHRVHRERARGRVAVGRRRGAIQRGAAGAFHRCCPCDRWGQRDCRLWCEQLHSAPIRDGLRLSGGWGQAGEWSCRMPVQMEVCARTRVRCRMGNGFLHCRYAALLGFWECTLHLRRLTTP